MNTNYIHPTHYGWVEKVKGLFPNAKIDESFRCANSYIEITVKKSETVELGLKLSFKSEEENFAAFGHISCICGSLFTIRQTCVLDVLGWDQAIFVFQTIEQEVDGSATYSVVDKLFNSHNPKPAVA